MQQIKPAQLAFSAHYDNTHIYLLKTTHNVLSKTLNPTLTS